MSIDGWLKFNFSKPKISDFSLLKSISAMFLITLGSQNKLSIHFLETPFLMLKGSVRFLILYCFSVLISSSILISR